MFKATYMYVCMYVCMYVIYTYIIYINDIHTYIYKVGIKKKILFCEKKKISYVVREVQVQL